MIELLRKRRSIRRYGDRPLPEDAIKTLKEAAVRAPSSRNLRPWRFIFIQDKDLLGKLSEAKEHGSGFLKGASLGIVVCGSEEESDVWVEDCSIASIILQLTAQSLDLGSCWIQIRRRAYSETISAEEYIRNVLRLSPALRVESIIAIGYPGEKRSPLPYEELPFDRILEHTK